mmetsp:Transcript_36407/g.91311  ORF Transcript_36407/g.91311 Transcript_36407/m.91311 type:complete len:174 (+) Transcript_36407:33-554(+)
MALVNAQEFDVDWIDNEKEGHNDRLIVNVGYTWASFSALGILAGTWKGAAASEGLPVRLRLNAVVNSASRNAGNYGNKAAAIVLVYQLTKWGVSLYRSRDDGLNCFPAGVAAGLAGNLTGGRNRIVAGVIAGYLVGMHNATYYKDGISPAKKLLLNYQHKLGLDSYARFWKKK